MLAELLHRLHPHPIDTARRTEICPPALMPLESLAAEGWRTSLRHWLGAAWHAPQGSRAQVVPDALRRVQEEFLLELEDIRTQQAGMVLARIRGAGSLRELWHLRPEIFNLVALRHSQSEAQARLDRLNRHFPTRSPRSGFAPLPDGGPRVARKAQTRRR